MRRAIAAAGIGFVLVSTVTPADDQRAFTEWDISRDGYITKEEFRRGIKKAGWFEQWDANNDHRIGLEEFNAVGFSGNFRNWDANEDGYLGPMELYSGIYTTYDEDEDGHWTLGEWDDADDAGWFDV